MKKIYFALLLFIFISASDKKDQPYQGFNLKHFEKSFCYIPGDTIQFGYREPDTFYMEDPVRIVAIAPFYLCNHEVTNGEYLDFLSDVKPADTLFYNSMLPDTSAWRQPLFYNEPYVEYYLRHPAYSNYPVVGISHEQANEYCKWLTKKYAGFENRRFQNAEFKLPTSDQWAYAAYGGNNGSDFPWAGSDMFDKNNQPKANFRIVEQQAIANITLTVNSIYDTLVERDYLVAMWGASSTGDITAPVLSYSPNGYGLYNMAGNVEEMIAMKGISKGGSWYDTGYHLMNSSFERYDSTNATSCQRGFRVMMQINP